MASRKKSVTRPRKAAARRRNARTGQLKRFIKTVSISATLSFVVASSIVNPNLRNSTALQPLIAYLNVDAWPVDSFLPSPLASIPSAVAVDGYVKTAFKQCGQFFPDQNAPTVPADTALRELCFTAFAILHSGNKKTPVFVAQRLNRKMLQQGKSVKRTDRFYEEARLPRAQRAQLADYRGSGFDRGHMAPAGDMHSVDAMAQSFSLANIVPQNAQHNRGPWSVIENDTRKYVMRARGDVHVFTGPVYSDKAATIGEGQVAVPRYLFKVVHDATTKRTWAHWHSNSANATLSAPISYPEFVRRTGIHLLPQTH